MPRRFFLVLLVAALTAALCPSSPLWAARSELIPDTTAAQHGLTRPWFTQVELDQSRGRLRDLVLYQGIIYAQTDKAMIHAIDAETGKTLWWKQVGQPKHPSMTPGVNHDLLAVLNGSRLYVLNRFNGDLLYEKEVGGAPGAGPALSAKRVYIPMSTGLIMAYRLDPMAKATDELEKTPKTTMPEEKAPPAVDRQNLQLRQKSVAPLFCQSYGQALVQPLVIRENASEEFVVWPTDRGYLNLGRVDRHAEDHLTLKYRLETGSPIVGRPAYLPPDPKVVGDSGLIIAASRDGFVHVIKEKDGERLWRFSTGEAIVESPAVIEDRVYVSAQLGGMYCLAVKTGKELWFAPDVVQFVAASKARVYATDRIGRLTVLNADSGARLDAIATENVPIKLLNTDTDRIYLADDGGLIQCLREVEQSEPIMHGKDRKQVEEVEEQPADGKKEVGEKEKPAKKEHVAPKERPAPKERVKKTNNKKATDAAGL
jgi:outer membrane protein assembly factor BamB